jgi:hypothetical protein
MFVGCPRTPSADKADGDLSSWSLVEHFCKSGGVCVYLVVIVACEDGPVLPMILRKDRGLVMLRLRGVTKTCVSRPIRNVLSLEPGPLPDLSPVIKL